MAPIGTSSRATFDQNFHRVPAFSRWDPIAVLIFNQPKNGLDCSQHLVRRGAWIAVGTRVTPRPPHRSGRAQFRHPAPTSGVWRRTADLARDEGSLVSEGSH